MLTLIVKMLTKFYYLYLGRHDEYCPVKTEWITKEY